jgi:2-polyprenyl-6-methoxyphenol hydroxylase-like FAD-dependent oxidoreductase
MVKRAQELRINIRWGHSAIGHSERGVHIESSNGVEYLPASLVVVADGARSAMRSATTAEGLHFLNTAIVGGVIEGSLPDPVQNRHGLIVGSGCSVFSAQETPQKVLVSMSFPVEREVDRKADDAWLKSQVLLYMPQFPTLEKQLLAMLESPTMFAVNCRDRMPLKGIKPLIFLGDASHAVSPFAGAGANMALIDGTTLGKLAAQENQTYEGLQRELEHLTFKKWEKVVLQQRSTISMCHSTTLRDRGFRFVFLRSLPLFISPSYKIIRRLISLSVVVAVMSAAAHRAGIFRGQ